MRSVYRFREALTGTVESMFEGQGKDVREIADNLFVVILSAHRFLGCLKPCSECGASIIIALVISLFSL